MRSWPAPLALLMVVMITAYAILGVPASAWAAPSDTRITQVTLQLQWKHQFEFAGFYAAKEKGYYREAGLDVDFHEFQLDDDIEGEVLSGRREFGVSDSRLVSSRLNGKAIVMVANYFKHSPLVLLTSTDIRHPSELKGKRLMIARTNFESYNLQAMFQQFGIKGSDIDIQPYDYKGERFINGKVDGMGAFLTNEPYFIRQAGKNFNVLDPSNYGVEMYDVTLFTSEAYAINHPDVVRAFRDASNRGWQYAIEHKDEIVDLILAKYNTQNKPRAALRFEADETERIMLPKVYPIGSMDDEKLRHMGEMIVQLGQARSLDGIKGMVFDTHDSVDEAPPLILSEEEKAFLREHPVIRVHNEQNWAPYNFYRNGRPQGYTIDLLNELTRRLGIRIDYVTGPSWEEFTDQLRNRQIDVIGNMVQTPERESYAIFTAPVIAETPAIVSRTGSSYTHIDALNGKTVAVVKGFWYQEMIEKSHPRIRLKLYKDTAEALKAVSFGDADAVIDAGPVMRHLILDNGIGGLAFTGEAQLRGNDDRFDRIGVRKDWPALRSALDKALLSMSYRELQSLRAKWLMIDNTSTPSQGRIVLSADESAWLARHPTIRVSSETDYPPYDFASGGQPQGFSIDMMNAIASRVGFKVEYVNAPTWDQLLNLFNAGRIDLMHSLYESEDRRQRGIFSQPYHRSKQVFVTRKNNVEYVSLAQLEGKTIAVGRGWAQEEFLMTHYPGITRLVVNNVEEMLDAVASGKADATIESEASVRYWIQHKGLNDLKVSGWAHEFERTQPQFFHFYAHKADPQLISMINKAMASMTAAEIRNLQTKWLGETEALIEAEARRIELSESERAYLNVKRVIRMCVDPDWAPFERINGRGEHEGMAADFIKLIAERTGSHIELFPTRVWAESIDAAMSRKCDVLSMVTPTPDRRSYMDFTTPYVSFPLVMVARQEEPFVDHVESVLDKPIAMVKGYAFIEIFRRRWPNVQIVEVANAREGLRMVEARKVHAYVDALPTIVAALQGEGLLDLKIIGRFDDAYDLSVATRKDEPMLRSIMQKGIDSISEEEKRNIVNKWVSVRVQQGIDYAVVWRVVLAAALLVTLFIYWNRRLARVNHRMKRMQDEVQARSVELESIFQAATLGLAYLCDRRFVRVNRALCELFGYEAHELIGMTTRMLYHDDASYLDMQRMYTMHMAGERVCRSEVDMRCKDGSTITCVMQGAMIDQQNIEKGVIVTYQDVTERNHAQRTIEEQNYLLVSAYDQVAALLDNSGQGFLSIDDKLEIEEGYSRECSRIFGVSLQHRYVPDLLSEGNEATSQFLAKAFRGIMAAEDDALRRDAYIHLLPNQYSIRARVYRAEYKPLSAQRMMLVLTDVTEQRELEAKLQGERQRLEFVVHSLENRDDLIELMKEYEHFRRQGLPDLLTFENDPERVLVESFRQIHTYKSLFAQAGLPSLPQVLHGLESQLTVLRESATGADLNAIKQVLGRFDLRGALEADLDVLRSKLGKEYLTMERQVRVPVSTLDALETEARALYGDHSRIVELVHQLRHEPLRNLLDTHFRAAEQLAHRQGKLLAPISFEGDDPKLDPNKHGNFLRSLVHVFRNAVDHGIEDPDERLLADKDETAHIRCTAIVRDGMLEIVIEDDGRGLDADAIRSRAVKAGLLGEDEAQVRMERDIWPLIFEDGLTTSTDLDVVSGRGVGLSAVKQELELLGGTVRLESEAGRFTRFCFRLPFEEHVLPALAFAPLQHAMGLLQPLARVTEAFFRDHLRLDVRMDGEIREVLLDDLYAFSAHITLGNGVDATIGLSLERPLLLEMTHRFEPEFSDSEILQLCNSVGCEIANTIVGKTLVYLTHLAPRVAMGTPEFLTEHVRRQVIGKRAFHAMGGMTTSGRLWIYCLLAQGESA